MNIYDFLSKVAAAIAGVREQSYENRLAEAQRFAAIFGHKITTKQ